MLRRLPRALAVGLRAGVNSFAATLRKPRRTRIKTFYMTSEPDKKHLIAGDLWFEIPSYKTWVHDGRDFNPLS